MIDLKDTFGYHIRVMTNKRLNEELLCKYADKDEIRYLIECTKLLRELVKFWADDLDDDYVIIHKLDLIERIDKIVPVRKLKRSKK
jgi:hypothetical protein